ncbi:TolC family protein [Photobacterium indicum]|uniref:Copper transporter n=1 Tax=Photobacterium indicum TaxID=81447 RepID=A0A2T3LBF1_9GAMM|nr:TolC family protein [Photobacterium indicum]PSV48631.1 copper transporter [Photobacterium indicum]
MQPSILSRVLALTLMTATAQPVFATTDITNSGATNAQISASTNANTELKQLISWAIEHDAGIQQIHYQADAVQDMGVATSQWMDPKLKVGVGGLPVDSFAFDDDPMTNISVGLMQQFGRGNTLGLKQKQSDQQANSIREKAGVRDLELENAITTQWNELVFQQNVYGLLQQNQTLFRELEHYLSTNYGIGSNQAQDIIQAQLQIGLIDDKLQANQQMQQKIKAQLSEWIGDNAFTMQANNYPDWGVLNGYLSTSTGASSSITSEDNYQALVSHPSIRMSDLLIKSNETGIDIANEAYLPEFGVEVMYGYRQANGMGGQPASDLMSVYLTMDIPLFTEKRQDKKLSSAQHQLGAAKSQRDLLLRQMNAKINALTVDRYNLEQRIERYQDSLLKRAKEKTHAIERGYQNNTSQLDEYIRAASDELTLAIEQERLQADLQKTNSSLAYLLNKF